MAKLHYIDKLETKLTKIQIEERIKDIALEDQFFPIYVKGKKIYHAEFKDNIVSFFYLSKRKHDMLSPKIYITILEVGGQCTCNLYYSRTWETFYLFILWTILAGICVYGSALGNNYFNSTCYIVFYVFGIWITHRHYNSICRKVINILKAQINF